MLASLPIGGSGESLRYPLHCSRFLHSALGCSGHLLALMGGSRAQQDKRSMRQGKRGFFSSLGRAVTLILIWIFAFFYLGAAANWGNWGLTVAFIRMVSVLGLYIALLWVFKKRRKANQA